MPTTVIPSDSIWTEILNEICENSKPRLPSGKSVLLLGDYGSGKSSLLCKLKNVSELPKRYILGYDTLEVTDEENDDSAFMGLWIGDDCCKVQGKTMNDETTHFGVEDELKPDLPEMLESSLITALNAKSFDNFVVLLVVTMSNPWDMLDSLRRWLTFLENYIESKLVDEQQKTGINNVNDNSGQKDKINNVNTESEKPYFMSIQDPWDEDVVLKDNEKFDFELPMSQTQWQEHKDKLIQRFAMYSEKSSRNIPGTLQQQHQLHNKKGSKESTMVLDETAISLMLQDVNLLTKNLGLPILVVLTKTDLMKDLKVNCDFTNEMFDFMQLTLRRICLNYGAGLIYTSCLEDINCDVLKHYLIHLLYGFPFDQPPKIIENESIFIPIGWDTTKKISILIDSLSNINPDSEYRDVLGPHPFKEKPLTKPLIQPEDEQTFLARMHTLLQQTIKSRNQDTPIQKGNLGSLMPKTATTIKPSPVSSLMNTPSQKLNKMLYGVGGEGSNTPLNTTLTNMSNISANSTMDQSMLSSSMLLNNHNSSSIMSTPNHSLLSNASSVGNSESNSERVLIQFFNNLLNKGANNSTTNVNTHNTSSTSSSTKTPLLNMNNVSAVESKASSSDDDNEPNKTTENSFTVPKDENQ